MDKLFKLILIIMIGLFAITGSGGGDDEDDESENGNGDTNPTTVQQWAWISGDSRVKETGTYGTQGTGSTSNIPGARYGSSSWIDSDGDLWLFGGCGYDKDGNESYLNDLWKYDPSSEEWTWISGSSTVDQSGTYTSDGSNFPGARYYAMSWIDSSDNLWLFGGYGYDVNSDDGDLNDLWKFSPISEQWTWVSGSNTIDESGTYGDKGEVGVPGARELGISWIDSNNNLWLFGGYGYDSADSGLDGELNDLWMFDPDSDSEEWTWVDGHDTADQLGTYGTKDSPSSSYYPGARDSAVSWMDSSGNMWFFGGWGFGKGSDLGFLNDLWRYNPNTKEWTWFSGGDTDTIDQPGTYGTTGTAASSNVPGARYSGVSWVDSEGYLWLFGGYGYDSADSGLEGELNDLWKFDPSSEQWTWVSGSSVTNQGGVYGTMGTGDEANVPGARYLGVSWIDSSDNLWLFGGYGYDVNATNGELNDLWQFER